MLLAKLSRTDPGMYTGGSVERPRLTVGTSAGPKRSGADEVSKLRDVILKQRDQIQNQSLKYVSVVYNVCKFDDPLPTTRWVEMVEEVPSYLYPGLVS
jgi:hypothetical protein